MSEAIIVAAISGGLALIGTIITVLVSNKSQAKDLYARMDKHQAVTDEKIDELSRRVDKHNNMIDRTYALEKRMAVAEARIDGMRDDSK